VIPAVWVVAIAIIAVQNATPGFRIRLLNFQSIDNPFWGAAGVLWGCRNDWGTPNAAAVGP
jgi:hypothetical protein